MNIEVLYPITGKCNQIIGRTRKIDSNEDQIKNILFTIADTGQKYGYRLDDWRIEGDLLTKWHGG